VNSFAPWVGAERCTGGATKGATVLMAYLLRRFPSTKSDGIYNCRSVRSGQSYSCHAEGRALDVRCDKATGDAIVKLVAAHGLPLGVQAIIWWDRIWSAKSPNGRAYNGADPHHGHVHIELTRAAGKNLTLARIQSVLDPKPVKPVKPSKPSSTFPLPAGHAFGRTVGARVHNGTRNSEDKADVKRIQRKLKVVPVSGLFGQITQRKVKLWQIKHAMKPTGLVGRAEWVRLGL